MVEISKRQLAKIYPGTAYRGRKLQKWTDKLFEKNSCCAACGSTENLQPHHIYPTHPWEKFHFDVKNGTILCKSCHDSYHSTCFPHSRKTLEEFCKNKKKSKHKKRKPERKYKLKKYESSPLYSKIRINDFRKDKPQKKKRKKKKRKIKRLNPIYLLKELGSDNWTYDDRIELEKEVLGDFYE